MEGWVRDTPSVPGAEAICASGAEVSAPRGQSEVPLTVSAGLSPGKEAGFPGPPLTLTHVWTQTLAHRMCLALSLCREEALTSPAEPGPPLGGSLRSPAASTPCNYDSLGTTPLTPQELAEHRRAHRGHCGGMAWSGGPLRLSR